MLKKAYRLSDSASIRRLVKEGSVFRSDYFRLKWMEADSFKAVVIVSMKFSKSAVRRNKLKRRLRAVIEDIFADIKPDIWLVMMPAYKLNYEELDFAILKEEMKRFLDYVERL